MASESDKPVIVRLPPSPTGYLHIGNVRTLLFNFLYARKHGGRVILRVEDTDKERSKREYEEYMIEALDWLGITYDERHRQSDRTAVYQQYLEQMIQDDLAYVSEEKHTPEQIAKAAEEGKTLRDSVIRFRNPGKVVTFHDEVLGEISIDTTDLGDFVIAKDMETPLYHLTVVIDDHEMGITHVIRGNDHMTNTPRHILLQEAIGAKRPIYAHLPVIVGSDGKKLGKRHGALPTLEYRNLGYLAVSMVNFLAFIGWNPGGEDEVFTVEELTNLFSLEKVQKGSAVFNEDKLRWLNRQHLAKVSDEDFFAGILDMAGGLSELDQYSESRLRSMLPLLRERIDVYGQFADAVMEHEYDYFFTQPEYDGDELIWKKSDRETAIKHLRQLLEMASSANEEKFANPDDFKSVIWDYADQEGRGDVLWPLRYCLSGRSKSADPFTIASTIGKTETIERIQSAINKLTSA